ncbi:unnamed protein product, partial [Trichogramma brassicae]
MKNEKISIKINEVALILKLNNIYRADTSILNGFGETLLYLAVELDKYDIVELLLRNGADPDEADNLYQRTALSIACLKEYVRIIELLLQYNADPNKRDGNDGNSPLHISSHFTTIIDQNHDDDRVKAIKLLLEYNADVHAKDSEGYTPMLCLYKTRRLNDHHKIASDIFLLHDPRLDDVNNEGETVLHLIAKSSYCNELSGHSGRIQIEIAQMLVERGADINAKDCNGHTPLQQRAVINAKDCHSPLQVAVSEFNYNLVKLFCDYNADFKNLHFQWQPIDLDDRQADQEVLNVFRIINFMEDDMELKDHLDILNFFIPIYKDFDFIDFNNLLEIARVARADEKNRDSSTTLTHPLRTWCLGFERYNMWVCLHEYSQRSHLAQFSMAPENHLS